MADERRTKIVIPRDGITTGEQQVRGLDTQITNKVVNALGGKKTITRASNVEPGSGLSNAALDYLWKFRDDVKIIKDPYQMLEPLDTKWFADLLPVNGPVLGPFDDRQAALAAEEAWLHEHHIPVCQPCRQPPLAEFMQTWKTGRSSNAAPEIQRLPSPFPNVHTLSRPIPAMSPELLVRMDFSGVEARMLQEGRLVVADAIRHEAFLRIGHIEQIPDWIITGDIWQCEVVLTDDRRYNVTLTFYAGQCSVKDQQSVPV